ncbi:reticulon-4-like isoform X2 [Boleophthalmus pectinirostris]|uniref:reticulon-4-like isoform X2 n=1 Tax=Boleophthalmus pectinirostris TaxID=150288 RepID=UPI00242C3271|nr:reticulon-4-like isoform X2 [Boleophthalmus pectinirostris]
MADSEEQVTSTTTSLLNDVVHHYEPEPELEQPKADHFSVEDIVDLVGGARDALERHIAEDSAPHEVTETLEEHPVTLEEPAPVKEPEPEIIVPEPAPVVETTISEPEPVAAPEPEPVVPEPVVVPEPEPVVVPEPEPAPVVEAALPDSTTPSIVPEVPPVVEEPVVVAPIAEPEITTTVPEPAPEPEPQPEPEPEPAPAPVSDALPVAEPHKEAPAPVEAAAQPAVTEEPPAPASLVDLLYWRDVKSTGAVFGAILLLLLSLTMCSIVSVCSYIGLALLSVTICFRIYKGILQAIQKSDEGHPFKQYLDHEVALSEDMVHKYSDMALSKINKTIADLRRLFLVEDLVDSIKFAVLMWILTYVGALFNGLTLVILAVVAAFSCPIIYEKHQAQIDHYLALVNNQIKDVVGKIQAKVPGMKRKSE